jgi:hypothetical protein
MKNGNIIEKEIQPRIHVKTLEGELIFGSLKIGRLIKSDQDGVYLADGVPVTCDKVMLARINERLDFLGI